MIVLPAGPISTSLSGRLECSGSKDADQYMPIAFPPAAQVEAIKQAMAGFSLPTSAVPQWAKMVPEDVWKAELIGGLQTKPKHKPQ